jgi:hypothetical protein
MWYFKITKVIHSNPFRFPLSSLGLPIFFLRIAEREQWQKYATETAHQTERIVTHNNQLCNFYSNIHNFFILLFNHIPTTDLLSYWSICHELIELIMAFYHNKLVKPIMAIHHNKLIGLITAFGHNKLGKLIGQVGHNSQFKLS